MFNTKFLRSAIIFVGINLTILTGGCAALQPSVKIVRATATPALGTPAALALPQTTPTPASPATPTATRVIPSTSAETAGPPAPPSADEPSLSAIAGALLPTPTSTAAPTQPPPPAPTQPPPEAADCTCQSGPCPCRFQHVVIISIDGLRPDALNQADTPVIDGLRAAGAYHPQAKAVVPSVTLINHASMLSGMSPAKHGINWNVYDESRGKIKGPTLFSVARQAGLSTAMVVGKDKLEHLVLPGSVDNYTYAGFTDLQVVDRALEVIEAGLPNVLFIHLPDVDSAGHLTGWMSTGQLLAVSLADGQIGRVMNQLEAGGYLENTLVLITADHGGSGTQHGSDSPEDTTIPWLAVGPGVPTGTTLSGQLIVYDTAATALHALNLPIPENWDGRPVMEIFN